MADRAVRNADAGEKKAEKIVNFGDGGDGAAGISGGGFLVNRNSRRETSNRVAVGFVHDAEKHASIRRERLDITALTLGIDGVEGERGLAGAGEAGNDDELVARNVDVDVF